MVSSSTSHRVSPKRYLRLRDLDRGSLDTYALYGASTLGASIDMSSGVGVYDDHSYQIQMLSEEDFGEIECVLTMGDWVSGRLRAQRYGEQISHNGTLVWLYLVFLEEAQQRLFDLAFGFVRVEVEIYPAGEQESLAHLSTKDIPCLCHRSGHAKAVVQMLEELMGTEGGEAARWMLYPSSAPSRFSILKGDTAAKPDVEAGQYRSNTVSAQLSLAEAVLNAYEANMAYFRQKAHSTIQLDEHIVSASRVRSVCRKDVQWLVQNSDLLGEVGHPTGILIGEKRYLPFKMRTSKKVMSFDNYENRLLLAFLDGLSATIEDIMEVVVQSLDRAEGMKDALSSFADEDAIMPSLIVARACLERERPLLQRACAIKDRVIVLRRAYRRILPGVAIPRVMKMRKTKIFQEVRAYNEIYTAIERWQDSGPLATGQEGMALEVYRSSKLFEYYALLKILQVLHGAGFHPKSNAEEPIRLHPYELNDGLYENERQVANVYELENDEWACTLYYQPVFYADARQEAGIAIHRTTDSVRAPYYTPDYLLVAASKKEDEPAKKHVVALDAKFTNFYLAQQHVKLDECVLKYIAETSAESIDDRVEAVWLLCGREEQNTVWEKRLSAWALNRPGHMPSGLCALNPACSGLGRVLALFGLASADGAQDGAAGLHHARRKKDATEVAGEKASPKAGGSIPDALDGLSAAKSKNEEDEVAALRESEQEKGLQGAFSLEGEPGVADGKPVSPLADDDADEETLLREPKPKKRAIAEDEAVDLACRLIAVAGWDSLRDLGFAEAEIGLSQPVLRRKRPAKALAKIYTKKACTVGTEKAYVLKEWSDGAIARAEELISSCPLKPEELDAKQGVVDSAAAEDTLTEDSSVKSAPAAEIAEGVLGKVRLLADTTVEKDSLFDAKSSFDTLGFSHALLKRTSPSKAEVRFYTKGKHEVAGESVHVYKAWRGNTLAALDRAIDYNVKASGFSGEQMNALVNNGYTADECAPLNSLETQAINLLKNFYERAVAGVSSDDEVKEQKKDYADICIGGVSGDEFGVNDDIWRLVPPEGKLRESYYPVEVGKVTVYFYRKWNGKSLIKLQHFMRDFEKKK
mgnify:CR=1 FL=1